MGPREEEARRSTRELAEPVVRIGVGWRMARPLTGQESQREQRSIL